MAEAMGIDPSVSVTASDGLIMESHVGHMLVT